MRIDRQHPFRKYRDFWEWLLDDWHAILIIALGISYLYYLWTTQETDD